MKSLCVLLALFSMACGTKEAASSAVPASAQPSPTPAPTPVAAPASGPVIASADREQGVGRVELIELKASGDTLMLKASIVNNSGQKITAGGGLTFSDPELGGKDYGSFGGIHLIDSVHRKKYLVLRDSAKVCLCSKDFPGLNPGERFTVFARFAAPPTEVTKVSVIIPTFLPMDDVAITR